MLRVKHGSSYCDFKAFVMTRPGDEFPTFRTPGGRSTDATTSLVLLVSSCKKTINDLSMEHTYPTGNGIKGHFGTIRFVLAVMTSGFIYTSFIL